MEKILSQEEINALFSTMSAENTAIEETAASEVQPARVYTRYDFCRSDRIPKDQIRAIHQLHANFARHYSSSLSAYLRALVEVSLISVDQVSYSEFLKQLADPTLFCSVSMSPMHGNVAIELSPPLVFPIIDMLLGGPGKPPPQNRTLTEIEMQIVEVVINLALRDLQQAWRSVLEISPRLESAETRPQMLQIVAPGEAVVAVGFEVKIGDSSGQLNLCIPSVLLKMHRLIFDQQKKHKQSEGAAGEADKIGEILRNAPVPVNGVISDDALVVEDLLSIAVGDIIQLNHPVDEPIRINVAGVPKFYGRIVMRRGKRAFEVSDKYVS